MHVFVTGATGYLGSAIAASLVRAKQDVTALVRSGASAARVESAGIQALRGDLRDPHSYVRAARTADAIVHAAVESGADRIDVDRVFVDALACPTLVYTSVLFVLGNVAGADERAAGSGPRAEHERIVLDAGGAVIRPGTIWGGEAWLFEHPLFIEPGENRWPLVHRDDVAELYRIIVERGARGVFHAVAEVLRARDVFPGRGVSLDDAHAQLGGFADALALDQDVSAPRSTALGWTPTKFWNAGVPAG